MHSEQSALPVDVILADGRSASIRKPDERDRDALVALHDQLDDQSMRMRFFSMNRHAGQHYVDHILALPGTAVVSLVAILDGRLVGLGTAERITPEASEVAFVVAAAEQGHGIGTLLLERLAMTCRAMGMTTLVADVLPDNVKMAQVFSDAGYACERRVDRGVLRYVLSTAPTDAYVSATRERGRLAGAESERRLALGSPSE